MVHLSFFVAVVILGSIIASSQYQCNEKHQIAAYLYGSLATVCLLLIDDAVIFWRGLVGGPFEENRRRPVVVGAYAQFALIIVFTAFALYGTVFVTSDKAEKQCWSRSPCQAIQEYVQDACVAPYALTRWVERDGQLRLLTKECQRMNSLTSQEQSCVSKYLGLASRYGQNVFNETSFDLGLTPFNLGVNESAVNCRLPDSYAQYISPKYEEEALDALEAVGSFNLSKNRVLREAAADGEFGFAALNIFFANYDDKLSELANAGDSIDSTAVKNMVDAAAYFPNIMTNVGIFIFRAFGFIDQDSALLRGPVPIPTNYSGLLLRAPWYEQCAGTTLKGCESVLGSSCDQWDIILSIDDSSDEKHLFVAALGVAWGCIGLSFLTYLLMFNSNSDYTSDEAWIRAVEKMGGLMGWSQVLKNSITEAGFTASEELGVLLSKLFGGIDMDLTDRLLGAYLAGERRDWRRLRTVMEPLERHGYTLKQRRGCMWGLCDGVGIDGYGLEELRSTFESTLNFMDGTTDDSNANDTSVGEVELLSNLDMVGSGPPILPSTPFADNGTQTAEVTGKKTADASMYSNGVTESSSQVTGTASLGRSIEVTQSFVRLDSSIKPMLEHIEEGAAAAGQSHHRCLETLRTIKRRLN
jgi:hypothetical protein